MSLTRSAGRAGAVLIPIALVLAACGGSTASGAPSGGASTVPEATSSAAAPGGSTGVVPPIALPSFDVGALTAGLANVDSYQVKIVADGVEKYSGTVITKPTLKRHLVIDGKTQVIIIDKAAWVSEDGTTWQSMPDQLAAGMLAGFDPTLFVGAFSSPAWAQSSQTVGKEDKNGISATHLKIDSSTLVSGFTGLPPGATINLWIAEKGYLVAWESTGFAGTQNFSIEVSNVDDPANKVDAPV